MNRFQLGFLLLRFAICSARHVFILVSLAQCLSGDGLLLHFRRVTGAHLLLCSPWKPHLADHMLTSVLKISMLSARIS